MSEPAEVDFEQFSCPLPTVDYEHVLLGHGSGGTLTADLIKRVFIEGYGSTPPPALEDQATLTLSTPSSNGHKAARIALTTDSFVVRPPFFPGGDIGRLAVHGTVNDLAVGGATPLYLSAAFILEEGLPMADLRRIVASMREACAEAGVSIVTGDTKVVDRGKGDQIFLTIGNCRGRRGPALSTGRVARVRATRPWASPSASANCARCACRASIFTWWTCGRDGWSAVAKRVRCSSAAGKVPLIVACRRPSDRCPISASPTPSGKAC